VGERYHLGIFHAHEFWKTLRVRGFWFQGSLSIHFGIGPNVRSRFLVWRVVISTIDNEYVLLFELWSTFYALIL
jgi:heat shock protein HspQ